MEEPLRLQAYETMRSRKRQRNIYLAVTLLPGLLLYTLFRFLPAFIGLGISLFDWRGVSLNMNFVELSHYLSLFEDGDF